MKPVVGTEHLWNFYCCPTFVLLKSSVCEEVSGFKDESLFKCHLQREATLSKELSCLPLLWPLPSLSVTVTP